MSFKKQYKNEINKAYQTNITFDGIKGKINMKEEVKVKKTPIILGSIGGAAVLAGACAIIIAVALNNANGSPLSPQDKKLSLTAVAESITPLISNTFNEENNKNLLRQSLNTFMSNTPTDQEIVYDLLHQFDTIIENDGNYTVESLESDKQEYKFKENITFTDLFGNKNSYSMYYNDVTKEEKQDDDEIEKISIYTGLAVKNEVEHSFRLVLEEETELDEVEVESKFYLYSNESKTSYTKITTSSEIEQLEKETSYSYEIVENGHVVTSYEMEVEIDPVKNETELSIELNEKEYSIERVIEGEDTFFYVEIENESTDQEVEWIYKKVIVDGNVDYILVE